MPKKIHQIIIVTVLATVISSCRSTDDYKRLAEAGTQYAVAVDSLLDTAGNIKLDATSEQLLKNDRLLNQTPNDYIELSQLDVEKLQILEELRAHNQLLKRYFERLQELATSNAPQQAQSEIEGIAGNLNVIGKKLRGSSLVTNTEVFKGITGFVVSSKIRGALRDELIKRGETINLELTTQEELLDVLGKSTKHDLQLIQLAQEQRLVIRPLIQPELISNEEAWIATRKSILTGQKNANQLIAASAAITDFKEIFQSFVEGETDSARINTLLTDIESFVALINTFK